MAGVNVAVRLKGVLAVVVDTEADRAIAVGVAMTETDVDPDVEVDPFAV